MRHFNTIIEQSTPPATNAIWLSGGSMKYFTNGKWTPVGESEEVSWDDIKDKPDNLATTDLATTTTSGLMSQSDKSKLDSIANNANAYVLPAATTKTRGGINATAPIADLASDADAATITTKLNSLLAALRTAGVVSV